MSETPILAIKLINREMLMIVAAKFIVRTYNFIVWCVFEAEDLDCLLPIPSSISDNQAGDSVILFTCSGKDTVCI